VGQLREKSQKSDAEANAMRSVLAIFSACSFDVACSCPICQDAMWSVLATFCACDLAWRVVAIFVKMGMVQSTSGALHYMDWIISLVIAKPSRTGAHHVHFCVVRIMSKQLRRFQVAPVKLYTCTSD